MVVGCWVVVDRRVRQGQREKKDWTGMDGLGERPGRRKVQYLAASKESTAEQVPGTLVHAVQKERQRVTEYIQARRCRGAGKVQYLWCIHVHELLGQR